MADGLMRRYIGLCIQDTSSMFFALIDIKQLDEHPLGLFTQTQIAAVLVAPLMQTKYPYVLIC